MSDARDRLERQVAGLVRRSRLRRALGGLLLTTAGLSSVVCVLYLPLPGLAGFRPAAGASLAGGVLLLLLGPLIGAAIRPSRADVVREADRRLGLDGALLTSVQVAGDEDAICRMLVRQTVGRIAGVPAHRALPLRLPASALLVPALMALAAGLTLRAAPKPFVQQPAPVRSAGEWVRLSGDLREIASGLLSDRSAADAAKLGIARKLMEIESGLRHGTLELEAGRAALRSLVDSHSPRPAQAAGGTPESSDGSGLPADPGAAPGWREALRAALGRGDSPARSDPATVVAGLGAGPDGEAASGGDGAAGRGDGAGTGSADLQTARPLAADPDSGERTWTLPDPSRFSGRATAGGVVAGTLQSDDRSLDSATSPLAGARSPLTNAERELVLRYLEALGRESRTSETAKERARSGQDG